MAQWTAAQARILYFKAAWKHGSIQARNPQGDKTLPRQQENNNIVMKEMGRHNPPPFDPKILAALGDGITVFDYRPGQVIYAQGDSGQALFYIRKGRVQLTVVSKFGKKAVTGVLGVGSFLGEGCLRGQPHAVTATVNGQIFDHAAG